MVQDASEESAAGQSLLKISKTDVGSSAITAGVDSSRFATPTFVIVTERGADSIFCLRFLKFSDFGTTDILYSGRKVALMVISSVIVIVQVFPEGVGQSVHSVKTDPVCAVAVTITSSYEAYSPVQVFPTQMSPSAVTLPRPVPSFFTVRT